MSRRPNTASKPGYETRDKSRERGRKVGWEEKTHCAPCRQSHVALERVPRLAFFTTQTNGLQLKERQHLRQLRPQGAFSWLWRWAREKRPGDEVAPKSVTTGLSARVWYTASLGIRY